MRVPCTRCSSGWMVPKYDGTVCVNCGKYAPVDVEVVMPEIPAFVRPPAADPLERKVFACEVVNRFYDSIAAQRKRGVGWETIAQLLRLSGHRVTTKAVNKYFLKEHDRRWADVEKTKTKIKAAA